MPAMIVTGAARGIGLELVRRALAGGRRVIATHRPGSPSPALTDLAAEHPTSLRPLALDVGDPGDVEGFGARVGEPVDALVNNAGVLLERNADTLAPTMTWAAFETSFRINAIAPLFVARSVLPLMTAPARILTISSFMGSLSYAKSDTTAYRASKAAVNKTMQALATDLAPRGIAVAVIHPGWVRTDMGGAGADLSVEESAAGVLAVLDRLDLSGTGRFYRVDGTEAPW